MGYSKKHPAEGGKESEGKKWVIAGIAIRAPLKSIRTTRPPKEEGEGEGEGEEGRSGSTTPTSVESRIPEKLACPPAPRKPRPTQVCHFEGVRDFFNPPDLESVFVVRHAERAN